MTIKLSMATVFLMAGSLAIGAIYLVGPGEGDDFAAIGPAISAAASGDSLIVAAGIYTGSDNRDLNFQGKDLVLLAAAGREATIIDCEGAGRALSFINGETRMSVVDGFTFRNGFHASYGGAIYCYSASLTLRNCRFEGNSAVQGGALYSFALGQGIAVENCSFEANSGDYGGALNATGLLAPEILSCSFVDNTGDLKGGAVYLTNYSSGVVSDCYFYDNYSLTGGALFLNIQSSPLVTGCTFEANTAQDGGAIGTYNSCLPQISECTFVHNSAVTGSSIHWSIACNGTLRNCILAYGIQGNSVACVGASPEIYRNLVWSNGSENLLCGNYYENIYLNPEFCGVANYGPYTLQSDSPAAPANNVYGELMGAWPVDCGEAAAAILDWSAVKRRY